jgi:hypothetical protein
MATRQRVPVGGSGDSNVPAPLTGTHPATCVSAKRDTSKAGNAMVVWHFRLDNGVELRRWTVLTSTDLHQTVVALGLDPAAVRLSEAAGKKCRLVISHDGSFHSIDASRPL